MFVICSVTFSVYVSVCVLQQESRLSSADDAAASVELSLDDTSQSTTNLAVSRQRPMTVPVHTLPADHRTFQKLVSYASFCMTLHSHANLVIAVIISFRICAVGFSLVEENKTGLVLFDNMSLLELL